MIAINDVSYLLAWTHAKIKPDLVLGHDTLQAEVISSVVVRTALKRVRIAQGPILKLISYIFLLRSGFFGGINLFYSACVFAQIFKCKSALFGLFGIKWIQ